MRGEAAMTSRCAEAVGVVHRGHDPRPLAAAARRGRERGKGERGESIEKELTWGPLLCVSHTLVKSPIKTIKWPNIDDFDSWVANNS